MDSPLRTLLNEQAATLATLRIDILFSNEFNGLDERDPKGAALTLQALALLDAASSALRVAALTVL